MKIGMNLFLWTVHVTDEHVALFSELKATGFDGVEVPMFEGDVAHYERLRREIDGAGLACTVASSLSATANPTSPDHTVRNHARGRMRWLLERTAALGAHALCGPFHSAWATFSGSESDRGTPGKGQVHWRDTFAALRDMGYDAWLVIESFSRAMPEFAAAVHAWRDFSASPEEVYREGYRFIRDMWDDSER